MSQDKFWEQWNSGAGQKPEEEKPAGETPAQGLDADVLAAWLQALPAQDPIIPAKNAPAAPAPPPAADAAWPPAAPVDPFAGIQKGGAGSIATDWDLTFDSGPVAPPGPGAPAPRAAPAADHGLNLGGAAGPAAPAAPAGPSPFGPPPPPVAPPADALRAAPLKLEITCGKRTIEQVIQGEALIGRPDATRGIHPEIDLRLDDAVSRRHAKIFVRSGRYILTDLNSTNGTRYNREWLQAEAEVALKPGDEIEVGERTLMRVLEAPTGDA